jgi:hypothetical protein
MLLKIKKIGPLVGLVMISFLAGCAEKYVAPVTPRPLSQVMDLNLSPEERRIQTIARQLELNQVAKVKERDPAEKAAIKIIANQKKVEGWSALRGCPSGTVWIDPVVTRRWSFGPVVRVIIANVDSVPLTISQSNRRVIIRDLCPGGSLTVLWQFEAKDKDILDFHYTAEGRYSDGTIGKAESEIFQLNRYIYNQDQDHRDWDIVLKRFIPPPQMFTKKN